MKAERAALVSKVQFLGVQRWIHDLRGAGHGELGTQAYNVGLGTKPPAWSREEAEILCPFLQRVGIACYAERCNGYSKSVRLSVRLPHAGTVSK